MNITVNQDTKKLWSKSFILMIIFNLLASMTHFMLVSTMPLYTEHIGGDNSITGLIMGAYTISALLFRPVFGVLLDIAGRKKILILGCVIFFGGIILQCFAASLTGLFAVRIIQGIGFSANSTAAGTVVSDLVHHSRLSEGIGYYGTAMTLATAVGPSLGLFFIEKISFNGFFLIAALIMLAGLIIVSFLNYERKNNQKDSVSTIENEFNKSILKVIGLIFRPESFIEKSVLSPAVIILFVAMAYSSVLTFISSFAISRGIGDGSAGLFFMVYAAGILITRLTTGRLADRIGATPVILPALVLMALALGLLTFTTSIAMFLTAALLYGLSFGIVQPLLNSIVIKKCPQNKRGMANATFFSAFDIGIAIGSIVWGIVSQLAGFTFVYLASAGCAAASVILYILLICSKETSVFYNEYSCKENN